MANSEKWPESYLRQTGRTSTGRIYAAPIVAYSLTPALAVAALSDLIDRSRGIYRPDCSSISRRLNREVAFRAAAHSSGCACATLLRNPAIAKPLLLATIRHIRLRRSSAGLESVFASALQTAWPVLSTSEVALAVRVWERSIKGSAWIRAHGILIVDGLNRTLRFGKDDRSADYSLAGKVEDHLADGLSRRLRIPGSTPGDWGFGDGLLGQSDDLGSALGRTGGSGGFGNGPLGGFDPSGGWDTGGPFSGGGGSPGGFGGGGDGLNERLGGGTNTGFGGGVFGSGLGRFDPSGGMPGFGRYGDLGGTIGPGDLERGLGGPFDGFQMPSAGGGETDDAWGDMGDAGQWLQGAGQAVRGVGNSMIKQGQSFIDQSNGKDPNQNKDAIGTTLKGDFGEVESKAGGIVETVGTIIVAIGIAISWIAKTIGGSSQPQQPPPKPAPSDGDPQPAPPPSEGDPAPPPAEGTPPPPSSGGGTPPPPSSSLPAGDDGIGGGVNWDVDDNGGHGDYLGDPSALPRFKGPPAGKQSTFPRPDDTFYDPEWGSVRPNWSLAIKVGTMTTGPGTAAYVATRTDGAKQLG